VSWSILVYFPGLFLPLPDSIQQLVDTGPVFAGTIKDEGEFRHMPNPHALFDLITNVAFGGIDTFQRLLRFLLIAFHVDIYPRAFAIGRKLNLRHIAQRNARVAQLAFQNDANLFFQGLTYAFAAVLPSSLLRHTL
jgi:hypothetical protein